jgi:hypothetical protein
MVKDNGGMGSLYRSQHELLTDEEKPPSRSCCVTRLTATASRSRPAFGG